MHLFSRKPSLETLLQRIYTDAYSNRLQSIVHESSFQPDKALQAWNRTLNSILAGIAQLEGRTPTSSQERGLYISIADMEKECRSHIAKLVLVQNNSDSALPDLQITDPDALASDLNQAAKSPPLSFTGDFPKNTYETGVDAGYPDLVDLSITKSDPELAHMPSVKEMPYKMYNRKPKPPVSRPLPVRPSSTPPEPNVKQKPALTVKPPPPLPQHSAPNPPNPAYQAYPVTGGAQSQPALQAPQTPQAPHSMRTLRKQPKPKHDDSRQDPLATRNAALSAAKQSVQMQMSTEFAGFDGCHLVDTSSSPSSPVLPRDPSPPTAKPTSSIGKSAPPPKEKLTVVYETVTTATGKLVQRPKVVRMPVSQSQSQSQDQRSSANKGHQLRRPVASASPLIPTSGNRPTSSSASSNAYRTSAPPTVPSLNNNSNNNLKSRPAQASSNANVKNTSRSLTNSPAVNARSPSISPNSSPSHSTSPSPLPTLSSDDFDRRAQHALETLKGVDRTAAEQILNEIVIKGDQVEWDDIAGLEKAKSSLKETVVYPFLRPDLFMGLREPVLGMLLFGPPGTGKTMLARAVATESRSTFFSISASSLTSKYMGESEKLVRALFQLARALAPSIIFVDEIDSILTQRQGSGEHEASRRIKNEFLVQWSDLQAAAAGKPGSSDDSRRVLVLGATNLPWSIDEAARRRFVRRQYIPLPEPETRKAHIEKLLSRQTHALTDKEIGRLVDLTQGYSGSDLTALAKDAAMGPLRALGDALLTAAPEQVRPIVMHDFLSSMQTIRPSVSPENLKEFEKWASLYGSSGA